MTGLIVTEWIEPTGGAERVLDRLANMFPDADMLCLWDDTDGRYADRVLRETWLARTPLRRHKGLALPLMPPTWRSSRGTGHEWAIVASHVFAHHVRERGAELATHVYVHTPARYLWAPELDARGTTLAARIGGPPLRAIDRRAAMRPTSLAANSRFVADRVERAWGREARVIHPPVDVEWIASAGWHSQLTHDEQRLLAALPAEFVFGCSRFIPYKRLDLVIATGELLGLPVVIAGSGPLESSLRARAHGASVPVHIELSPSHAMVAALMARAKLFVFPPIEDFGIVAVEAMAAGTPVLANREGGAGESVADGIGGALYDPRSVADTREAADRCLSLSRTGVARHALKFDAARFDDGIRDWLAPYGITPGSGRTRV